MRIDAGGRLHATPAGQARLTYDPESLKPLGLLAEAAGRNHHAQPESFSGAGTPWVPFQAQVAAAPFPAPDGASAAQMLVPTAVPGNHAIHTDLASPTYEPGVAIVWSVFAKAAGYKHLRLLLVETRAMVNHRVYADFDLDAGIASPAVGVFTDPVLTPTPVYRSSIQRIGPDGWFRCSVAAEKLDNDSTVLRTQLFVSEAAAFASYAGDGVKAMAIWGSQLELRTDAPGSYMGTATGSQRARDVVDAPVADWFTPRGGDIRRRRDLRPRSRAPLSARS